MSQTADPHFFYFKFLRCLVCKLKGSCKFWLTRASFLCEIVLHCTAELRAHCFWTNQLQNLKPWTSQLRFHAPYNFQPSPQTFLLMIFRMLLLLRQNSFRPRILGRKIKLKAISRVLGFAVDWSRGNVCVILQYSVAFLFINLYTTRLFSLQQLVKAVACLLLRPVYTINVFIDQTE